VSTTQIPKNGVSKPIIFNITASDSSLGNTGQTDVSPWQGLETKTWMRSTDRAQSIDFWSNSFFHSAVLLSWARITNCCLELFKRTK